MRKLYFLLVTLFTVFIVNAQTISATTYPFSATSGTSLQDMSSGTTLLVPADVDDAASSLFNIGFDFWMGGTRYSQFSANPNGLVRLGATNVTSAFGNDLASATNVPQIAPYWDDLWSGNNGKVHFKVVGSAPNRTLVIEWLNMQIPRIGSNTAGAGTFQLWLHETSGVIDFVYGNGIATNSANSGASIGFGISTTQFASVTLNATSTASTVAYGTATNTNTLPITAGTQFTFTPETPSADPNSLTFSSVAAGSMTLNWNDNASNEAGYVIYKSTDGVNYSFQTQLPAGSTSAVMAGLTPGTTYYWKVYAVTQGALSGSVSGTQATLTGILSGVKTVGTGGDYDNLTTAFAAINNQGLAGNITLQLISGYPASPETYPIVSSNNIVGNFTVTVYPTVSGLSITSSNTTGTLLMGNGTNITFDGRVNATGTTSNLVIENTATAGYAIRFDNDAVNNTINYCIVKGANTSATSGVIVFGTTTGSLGNSNNTISNNDVRDAATTPSNLIYGSGAAAVPNTSNTVSFNNLYNFFNAGAVDQAAVRLDAGNTAWTISNNNIYQTSTRTTTAGATARGVYINNTSGNGFIITNNNIGGGAAAATGTAWTVGGAFANRFEGIRLSAGTTVASNIQNNTIKNFSWLSSSGATTLPGVWIGIYVSSGAANIGTNTGNTIGSSTGTGSVTVTTTTSGGISYGIGNAASAVVSIANNNIGSFTLLGSTASISHSFVGIQNTSGTTIVISGNTIGSTVTANSINSSTASTSTTAQRVSGIENTSSTTISITNNTVSNLNNAYPTASSTLTMRGISSTSGVGTVTGNSISNLTNANPGTSTGTTASTIGLMYTSTSTGNHTIRQNTINSISNTAATAAVSLYGIYYAGASTGTNVIEKNFIHSLSLSSTSATATMTGITIAGGAANYQNNMIRLGINSAGSSITTGNVIVGIDKTTTTGNNIYHNSVYIGGTGVIGTANTIAFRRTATGVDDVRNNIFTNVRSNGAGTGKHYVLGLNAVTTLTLNNTVYYGNGTGFVFAYVGTPGTTDYATLAAFTTATSLDQLSNFGNPQFINPTGTSTTVDLHINTAIASPAEGTGMPIVTVTDDIDGNLRSTSTPDAGADEFSGISASPVISGLTKTPSTIQCTATARTINVTVTPGSSAVTSVKLNYSINGVAQTAIAMSNTSGNNWTATIPAATPANASVTWYVTATDANGFTASLTGTAYADAPLTGVTLNTSASVSTICAGSSTTLTVAANAAGTGIVGAGATTTNTYPDPFYSNWSNSHNQYLITATELTSAGLSAGNITSLGVYITSGTTAIKNISIKLANTTATSMSAFLAPAFTTVYTAATYTPTASGSGSLNTFTFSTPFLWDGTSNIVIEYCMGDPSTTATVSSTALADNTSYVSVIHTQPFAATAGSVVCSDLTSNHLTY